MEDRTSVEVRIEADQQLVRVVRLVASGVASILGVDVDAVDDLRITVDEGCTWLLQHGDGSTIDVRFRWGGSTPLEIVGETGRGAGTAGDAKVDRLVDAILTASCAEHRVEYDGTRARFTLIANADSADRAASPPETVG